MGFVVFFLISWLIISIHVVIRKNINLLDGTFIYLLILILSINFSWIIIDELNLIKVTKEGLPYTAFLLNRSIIIPIVILIHINLLNRCKTLIKRTVVLISSIFILVSVSFLSTRLNVTDYKNWSLLYEAFYFLSLHLIAILIYKLFQKASRDVVKTQ